MLPRINGVVRPCRPQITFLLQSIAYPSLGISDFCFLPFEKGGGPGGGGDSALRAFLWTDLVLGALLRLYHSADPSQGSDLDMGHVPRAKRGSALGIYIPGVTRPCLQARVVHPTTRDASHDVVVLQLINGYPTPSYRFAESTTPTTVTNQQHTLYTRTLHTALHYALNNNI